MRDLVLVPHESAIRPPRLGKTSLGNTRLVLREIGFAMQTAAYVTLEVLALGIFVGAIALWTIALDPRAPHGGAPLHAEKALHDG